MKNNLIFKDLLKYKALYLMMLPGFSLLLVFAYLPLPGILIAFKDLNFYGSIFESFIKSDWVGFDNFKFLFNSPNAMIITRNTVLYNLSFIILDLTLAVTLAISLNEITGTVMKKIYQSVFILPYFLSWVIVAYFVYALLSIEHGFINNQIIIPLGHSRIAWYYEKKYWPFILIFVNTWKHLGLNSVIYLAALSSINPEYYDAANVDGASKMQQIFHITIPQIVPLMVILTILAIGRIFRADFGLFYNVTLNSAKIRSTTEVIDTYVYKVMQTGDFGMAAAAGLYQSIVGFLLVISANKIVSLVENDYSLF